MAMSAKEMLQAMESMDKSEYILLDVRTIEEHDEEKIPGSVCLPLLDIDSKVATVVPSKDTKLFVYCRSGLRSHAAAYKLGLLGYTNVYNFGGMRNYPYELELGKFEWKE